MEKELSRKIGRNSKQYYKTKYIKSETPPRTRAICKSAKSPPWTSEELKSIQPSSCSTPILNKKFNFDHNMCNSDLMCTKKKVEIQMELATDNEEFDHHSLFSNDSLLENIDFGYEVKKSQNFCNIKSENVKQIDLHSSSVFKRMEESFIKYSGVHDEHAWDMSTTLRENEIQIDNNILISKSCGFGLSDLEIDKWSDQSMIGDLTTSPRKETNMFSENILIPNSQKSSFWSDMLIDNTSTRNKINENLFFGLPLKVKQLIKNYKGIESLYDWQEECLNLPSVKNRRNLVYALPTSGGKTLVAEILILQELLCREKNVLFMQPYVSIAQEKVRSLSPFAVELGFHVEEYAGSKGGYPPKKRRRKHTVYIATIEKGLGLIHSLIEHERLKELGLVVVDELHLIGEQGRGANIESALSKLIFLEEQIQIIGMSATIGNLEEIARFLRAETYTQNFRPVELTEYVKVADELFKVEKKSNDVMPLTFHSNITFPEMQQLDPDQIGGLVAQVVPDCSCLVFCPSKKNCENVASLVCQILNKKILEHKLDEKKALFNALIVEGNGTVCATLRKTLPYGIAYHHSGLTTAERSLLEEAFLAKTLCCICCTSTLAAGVNLPAKRVILRSPYVGMELISYSKYKQMVGRAGRAGLGETGESFLLCKPSETQKVGALLSSSTEDCRSQLDGVGTYNLVLSALALSVTKTTEDLFKLFDCTLLSEQANHLGIDVKSQVTDAIDQLKELGGVKQTSSSLHLTPIGKAAVKGNFDLKTAKALYADLKLAQESLVLMSYLHLLFLVTPYTMVGQIKLERQVFFDTYMSLGPNELQTAKVIGITDQNLVQLMKPGSKIKVSENLINRFYLSLILLELWNHKTLWQISEKYNITRGTVYNFLNSASAFASSVLRFCEELDDMWCFKQLLGEVPNRLSCCCSAELLPLMDLPAVKISIPLRLITQPNFTILCLSQNKPISVFKTFQKSITSSFKMGRAKQLFNAGYKSIVQLAKAEPKALVQSIDHMPRKVAHQIVAAAKLMILAKAESLQEEAEDVLETLNGGFAVS